MKLNLVEAVPLAFAVQPFEQQLLSTEPKVAARLIIVSESVVIEIASQDLVQFRSHFLYWKSANDHHITDAVAHILDPRRQISCRDDSSRVMETKQDIFQRGLYVREAGVVALP